MNDILPTEIGAWQHFESCTRELLESYGYAEIRVPVLERTELFKRAIGEHTDVVGKERVETNTPPLMGGEDFSFMLQARPGAFIFIGNGDSAGLHHPAYDFNDDAIPVGASFWARLVETAMPA